MSQTPKIIFLDFDGPLHPTTAIDGVRRPPDEASFLERDLFRWAFHLDVALSKAKDRENILIAAHSSWRQIPGLSQNLIREKLGPRLGAQYVGMTRPELKRWESIQEMCKRGGFDDFLIIDDAINEFPENLPQLVVCNPLKGLSDPTIQRRVIDWANEGQEHTEKHGHSSKRKIASAAH